MQTIWVLLIVGAILRREKRQTGTSLKKLLAFSFIYKMINNSFSEKVHVGVYLWIYLCQISSIGYVKVEISDIINCESLF